MRASPYEGISLRAPCEIFRHFLFSDKYYELTDAKDVANPCCRHYKPSYCLWLQHLLFFFHISCPLLHNLIDFKLTGLWSLVKLLFWAQRREKIIWLIPRSTMHLMPKTRVSLLLAPFLMKALLRLPCVFSSYIYSAPSLFFFISLWLVFEREREGDRRF